MNSLGGGGGGYRIPAPEHPAAEMKRHRSARYYAHRVRESLATRVSKLICTIFLFLLFLIGMITFILWLSLRPHRPRFFTQDFSIPALTQQNNNGFQNAQINFNVTARNSNQNIGVFYDTMQVSVFYQDESVGSTQLLYPFYQEPKNTTVLAGSLTGATLTVSSEKWQQFLSDRGMGRVEFRVELTSTIRFKISSWDSKHHRMHANCAVGVGPDGFILPDYKYKRCPVYFG